MDLNNLQNTAPVPAEAPHYPWKYIVGGIAIFLLLSVWIYDLYRENLAPVAEGPTKTYKVGLISRGQSYLPGVEGFKAKMAELGYVEGKNVVYKLHVVEKQADVEKAVADLLAEDVDIFHTYSTVVTEEVHKQTKTVPAVVGSVGDPLETSFVETLERPGKNVTGVNSLSVPLVTKRLELLVEAFPNIKKVALVYNPDDANGKKSFELATETAKKINVEIVPYQITKERDVIATIAAVKKKDVDGIVRASDSLTLANLPLFIKHALNEKLPFAVSDRGQVEQGGILAYGPGYYEMGEQCAVLVHKILNGANPAELPIEIPQVKLIVSLKTAKEIGVTFTDEFLSRVDVVIK